MRVYYFQREDAAWLKKAGSNSGKPERKKGVVLVSRWKADILKGDKKFISIWIRMAYSWREHACGQTEGHDGPIMCFAFFYIYTEAYNNKSSQTIPLFWICSFFIFSTFLEYALFCTIWLEVSFFDRSLNNFLASGSSSDSELERVTTVADFECTTDVSSSSRFLWFFSFLTSHSSRTLMTGQVEFVLWKKNTAGPHLSCKSNEKRRNIWKRKSPNKLAVLLGNIPEH